MPTRMAFRRFPIGASGGGGALAFAPHAARDRRGRRRASSSIDELADAVVDGVASLLGATRCTLLKAAPELLMPLGTADRGPLLDAELQVAGAVRREPRSRAS